VFHHADIHLSKDSYADAVRKTSIKSGITNNADYEFTDVLPGSTYYISVVSYNRVGISNPTPMTATTKITWTKFTPPQITGLRLDGETKTNRMLRRWTGKDVSFVWNKVSTISGAGHQPAGKEGLGAGEFYDNTHYKYIVEIWAGGIRRWKKIITDNKYTVEYNLNKLSANLTGDTSAYGELTIKVWAYDSGSNSQSIEESKLRVTNTTPSVPTGLEVVPSAGGVSSIWNDSDAIDHSHYQVRTTITGGSASSWQNLDDNTYTRVMTSTEVDTYGAAVVITVEIRDVDLFGNAGSIASSSATASQVLDSIFKLAIYKSDGSGFNASLIDNVFSTGGVTIG